MKKSWCVALVCAFVTLPVVVPATSSAAVTPATVAVKGKMLISANGSRLGAVYRVSSDGGAQVIVDGRMVTVPAGTLSTVNGELTTSLTKSEVLALH